MRLSQVNLGVGTRRGVSALGTPSLEKVSKGSALTLSSLSSRESQALLVCQAHQ